MKKAHVLAVALLLGLAAAFGLVAATRTAGIAGGARAQVSAGSIDARTRKLDQTERALRRALKDRPPALPAARPRQAQHVIFQRPAPLIVVTHTRGQEHEGEREAEPEAGDD